MTNGPSLTNLPPDNPDSMEEATDACTRYKEGLITLDALVIQLQQINITSATRDRILNSCKQPAIIATLPPSQVVTPELMPDYVPNPVPQMPQTDLPPLRMPTPLPSSGPITTIVPTIVPPPPVNQLITDKLGECRGCLDMIKELIEAISGAILQQIGQAINQAIAPVIQAQGILIGQINQKLDKCEQGLGKCYQSAMKPIQNGLREAYGYMMPCGVQYPTNEQVVYGTSTGDYLGSVGLAPPSYEQRYTQPTSTLVNEQTSSNLINQPVSQQTLQNVQTTQQSTLVNEQTPVPQTITTTNNYIGGTRDSTQTIEYFPLPTTLDIAQAPINIELGKPLPPPPKIEPPKFENFPGNPGKVPKWDEPTVCTDLDAPGNEATLQNVTGFGRGEKGGPTFPNWWDELWDYSKKEEWGGIKTAAFNILTQILSGTAHTLDGAFKDLAEMMRCKSIPLDAVALKIIFGFISHWTDGSLDGLTKGMEYKINEQCPQEIPSQAEINAMYLGGQIDKSQWLCYTKANNQLPNLAERAMLTERHKLTFEQALQMNRLGKLSDTNYLEWCKQNGVVTDADRQALEKATIDIPTVSDLIRMMTRDVADDAIVTEYGLDDMFEQKWKGNLKSYGDAQGIDDSIAKLHWRAHWNYPSNTQAFEMLHRLRPDSAFAQRMDAKSKTENGYGVVTTLEDVQELLNVNDLAPFWRDRLAAIAYKPMTRTDAQRAYQIGALGDTPEQSDAALKAIYMDEGYNDENADILVRFTRKLVAERLARKKPKRDYKKYVKWYLDDLITLQDLEGRLKRIGMSKEDMDVVISDATYEYEVKTLQFNVNCIKKDYKEGVIDENKAIAELIKTGLDVSTSTRLVRNVMCARKAKYRQVTAAKLCEWREAGLITAEDQLSRLVNLGYSPEDSDRIVKKCEQDINKKSYDALLKKLKAAEAVNAKNQKAAQAAERRANK